MPVVFVPGKGNIQFPDDMTPYQIQLTIEREIIPNRRPETISAPKQPEGGLWNAIKGIGADLAAAPSAFLATVQDISAGDIAELATGQKGVGAGIDALIPDIFGPDRAERAARAERFGAVAARTPEKQAALSSRARAEAAAPNIESPVGRMAYSAASSLAQMAPGLAASVATGSPIPAFANIGAITFPEAYQRYDERGGTPQEALTGAIAETGVEVGTEMLPLGVVVKQLGKVGFGKFLKEFLGKELIGEEIATITQGAIDTAIANPDKTWGDYVNELPMQMVETAGSTLLTGGVLAGAGAIAKRVTGAQEPTEEAPAGKRAAAPPPPPPPPPADFAQKLGAVGSKITLNEPGGVNEYTYRGMDEDGRVIIEAEDGSMFAEDPAEINAAIDVGAVVPEAPIETTVPGVAFGEPVVAPEPEDEVEAEFNRRNADINARMAAEEAKLKAFAEEALRLKAEAENKPVSQPAPEPGLADVFAEPAPAPEKPGPMPLPLAKDAKDIIGEYSQGRETSDLQQIMSIASDLARQYGKRSITKDILFKAGQRFDGIPPVEAAQAAATAPEEKFTVTLPPAAEAAPAAPSPSNAEKQSTVGVVNFDQVNGIGSVPYNQNVNHMGFTAMMKPSKFLELAADLDEPKQKSIDYIRKSIGEGAAVGSPFLQLDFKNGEVKGHDGRHRMMVIQEMNGDQPVPVHFFGAGEQRARLLDEGKISTLRSSITGEGGNVSSDNFSEAFLQGKVVPTTPSAPVPAPEAAPAPAVASGPEITDDPVQTASNVYAHLLSKGTAKLSDMVKPLQWEGQIRELADNPSRYHAVKDDPTTGFKIGDRVTIKSEPDAEAYVVTTMSNNGKPIIGLADDTGYGGFVSPEEISHYDGEKGRPAPAPTKSEQDLRPELERIMGKFHPQLREKFMLPQLQEKIASGEPFTVDDIPDALRRNISQDDRVLVARALSKNPQQVIDAANSVSFKTPAGDVVYPTAAQAEAAPAAPRAVGNKATVTIPATRNKVEVQDELLDLADVKFAEGELQNRDRSRPQTQQFLRRFINEFDPEGLGEDRSTDRGAPIINKDNVILSGNGRTMGLEEIYEKHPEQAKEYRQFLRDNGWNIEGIERPFLARRLLSDIDEREFVTGSNEADIAALSPPEQAAQDAQDILKPAVLAKYNGGDLKAAKNDAFVSAFLAEMSPQQRENAMDDKGNISSQALKRIENALLYKAYGQAGRASNIFISKAMERSDDDTKTLTNSLVDVAKDWIKFQQAVKNGEIDKKYDITGKLMETVGTVSDIKTSGAKLSDALRSPDMVNPMDPFVRDILMSFYNENLTRMLSKKAIAEKLYAFTEVAANQQPEPDMFGKAETPSARDIWKRVDAGEGAPQSDLYQSIEGTSSNLAGNPTSADIMRLAQGLPPAQRVNVRASLDKIMKRYDSNGNVNRLIFDLGVLRDAVDARIERDREKRSRDRVRGFERAMENIYRGEREGKLKSKSADLMRWLLQKNPRIADDLAISITSGIDQGSAGDYGSAGRLASIFYSNASEGTGVHEVLHHTERMMPQKVRDGIRGAWSKRIEDLIAIAENTKNDDMREVLGTIVKAYYGDNVARKELKESYEAGTIPYSMYHLSNPSEFWAVNATKLVGKRAEQTGWLGAARKWLGDFIEKVKDLFGFTNNSAIIKGLDAVLTQESGVMRGGMLGEGARRARRAQRYGDVKRPDEDGEPKVTSMREVRDERLRKSLEKEIGEFNERLDGLSNAMDKEPEFLPQMQVGIKKTLQSVYNKLDDLYINAPTELEPALDDIEERIVELQKKLEAGLPQVANQNAEVPLTELEKAEAEYNAANEKHMDFFYNMDDERQFVDRRFKARKEYDKELDQLEQAHRAARDKWEKLYQKETERLSETMLKGSVKDVKQAISNAQKPDDLIMDERAYLQKKNRGCD